MDKNWTEYQCNSGQTLFVYNKETGQHKWPHQLDKRIEYRIMHGRPVEYKEFSTTATQTDDNGCNNGCMSIYINTDPSNIAKSSNASLPQQKQTISESNVKCEPAPEVYSPPSSPQLLRQDIPHETGMQVNIDQRHIAENVGSTPRQRQARQPGPDSYDDVVHFYNYFDHDADKTSNTSHPTPLPHQQQTDLSKEANSPNDNISQHRVSIKEEPRDEEEEDQRSEITTASQDVTNESNNGNIGDNGERPADAENHRQISADDTLQLTVFPPIQPAVLHFNVQNAAPQQFRIHVANNSKRFECPVCKKKFGSNSEVRKHSVMHTGLRPYKCSYCGKTFRFKSNLKIHERIHTNERPFECNCCKLKFKTTSVLNKHVRVHFGEEPFECSVCQIKFSKKSHFNAHVKTHAKEKKFACHMCNQMFTCNNFLAAHLMSH